MQDLKISAIEGKLSIVENDARHGTMSPSRFFFFYQKLVNLRKYESYR